MFVFFLSLITPTFTNFYPLLQNAFPVFQLGSLTKWDMSNICTNDRRLIFIWLLESEHPILILLLQEGERCQDIYFPPTQRSSFSPPTKGKLMMMKRMMKMMMMKVMKVMIKMVMESSFEYICELPPVHHSSSCFCIPSPRPHDNSSHCIALHCIAWWWSLSSQGPGQ